MKRYKIRTFLVSFIKHILHITKCTGIKTFKRLLNKLTFWLKFEYEISYCLVLGFLNFYW